METATEPNIKVPVSPNSTASPKDEEVPFGIEELFFSRTDGRGVIQSGNDVFQRVSGFEWSKLLGAPHKLVRHDDMPKAVFQILWARLKDGLPVSAYIKNRSDDGRHYWVNAFVTPTENGYLSVRIKPSSGMLDTIKEIYADVRRQEKAGKLSGEQGAELLLARLNEMGHDDYLGFSAHCSALEMKARSAAVQSGENLTYSRLQEIQDAISVLDQVCLDVVQACTDVAVLPTNLQIRSARLGAIAGPIGIIASDCGNRTRGLLTQMEEFSRAAKIAKSCVDYGILQTCIAQVQGEAVRTFENVENLPDELDLEQEKTLLDACSAQSREDMLRVIKEVETCIIQFSASAKEINNAIVGLNVTRIMCAIESNILGPNAEGIRNIVLQLETFQSDVPILLKKMEDSIAIMKKNISLIMGAPQAQAA